jgi:hypothetical protein
MSDLTSQRVRDSYRYLLQLPGDVGTLTQVQNGRGEALPLSIWTGGVSFTGAVDLTAASVSGLTGVVGITPTTPSSLAVGSLFASTGSHVAPVVIGPSAGLTLIGNFPLSEYSLFNSDKGSDAVAAHLGATDPHGDRAFASRLSAVFQYYTWRDADGGAGTVRYDGTRIWVNQKDNANGTVMSLAAGVGSRFQVAGASGRSVYRVTSALASSATDPTDSTAVFGYVATLDYSEGTLTAGDVVGLTQLPAAPAVLTVAGRTGNVTLSVSDVSGALSSAAAAATYQPLASGLTSWAAVTRASGFDAFAAAPSGANLAALLTTKTGTGLPVFNDTPTIATIQGNTVVLGASGNANQTAALKVRSRLGDRDMLVVGDNGYTQINAVRLGADVGGGFVTKIGSVNETEWRFSSDAGLTWTGSTAWATTLTAGLRQSTAGVLEVNNGSSGNSNLATLTAATLIARQPGGATGTHEGRLSHDGTSLNIAGYTARAVHVAGNSNNSGYIFGGTYNGGILWSAGSGSWNWSNSYQMNWGSYFEGANVGLGRSSSGILEVNSGTPGARRDLLVRALTASGNVTAANLSGTNTGDQTVALTGDVTGSGTGSFAATIAAGAVTLAKMANLAANSLLGNNTGVAATPIALTPAQTKTLLGISASDVSGLGALAALDAAPAGTLTGSSLASGVTASSLTSVGTLTGGTAGSGFLVSGATVRLAGVSGAPAAGELYTSADTLRYRDSTNAEQTVSTAAGVAAAYQPLNSNLTSWASVSRASGFDTFASTPSSANLASLLTTKTGTGLAVFDTSPTLTAPTVSGTLTVQNAGATLGTVKVPNGRFQVVDASSNVYLDTNDVSGNFQIRQNVVDYSGRWAVFGNLGRLHVGGVTNPTLTFGTNTLYTATAGIGLNATGVVEFNSGTAGTLRDWTARNGTLTDGLLSLTSTGFQSLKLGIHPTAGSHGAWGSVYNAGYWWGALGTQGTGSVQNQGWQSTTTTTGGASGDLVPTYTTMGIRWNNDTRIGYGTSGGVLVTNTLTTAPQLMLKATASQTANIQEWQTSAAAVGFAIDSTAWRLSTPTSGSWYIGNNSNYGPVLHNNGTNNTLVISPSSADGNRYFFDSGGLTVGPVGLGGNGASLDVTRSNDSGASAYPVGRFTAGAAAQTVLIARGAASHTGNLFEAQNSSSVAKLFVSPAAVYTGLDSYYLGLKPGTREYRIGTYDGGGQIVFNRSDGVPLKMALNSTEAEFSSTAGIVFATTQTGASNGVIFNPAQGGGAGLVQFGRRKSDSNAAVGATSEFWPITGQTTPVFSAVEPGGGTGGASPVKYTTAVMLDGTLRMHASSTTTGGSARADITSAWVDSTHASRTGRLSLGAYYTTTFQEGVRVDASSGGTPTTSFVGAYLDNFKVTNPTDSGTTVTLGGGTSGRVYELTSGSAVAVTLSATAPVGWTQTVLQAGAGQATFSAAVGATLRNRQSHTKTAGQWAEVTLYVRANSGGSAAEWVLAGDTAA